MSDSFSASVSLLPLVIAQVPGAERSEILTVLLGGAALAVIANQFVSLWRNATGRFKERDLPGPRVQTIEDCQELHTRLDATVRLMSEQHNNRTEQLRREIKADVAQVYERIEDKTDGINNRLTSLFQAVGDIAGQVKRIANGKAPHQ